MRPGTKLLVYTSLAFTAGVFLTVISERLYATDDFVHSEFDMALAPPITTTKILMVIAAIVTVTAIPFGLAEWRSERAFVKRERALRASRPADAVTAYEGPEGRGFLFDGPDGRLLLLEASGGIGEPRTLDLPPAVDVPSGEGAGRELHEPSYDGPATR